MTEYELCKAIQEGYAKQVSHASGSLFVCYSKECPMNYKILGKICKEDGLIPIKALKKSLVYHLVQKARDTSGIKVNLI